MAKATPIFVDSDPYTFNMSPADLENKIRHVEASSSLRIKAIVPVDLFGLPANYPELKLIAKKYDLKIIEDAAQGFGGAIGDERACSFGDIATTSFFPAKPLGCYGDGGALFTDDDDLAQLLLSFREHGKGVDKYDNVRIGLNSRLDTLQAAILLEKLAVFPDEFCARNIAAAQYESRLNDIFETPSVPDGYQSSWAQYTLTMTSSRERASMQEQLKARGIPSAIYYGRCMHQQTAFSEQAHGCLDFSVAESFATRVLSLPMHPYLTERDIEAVVDAVIGAKLNALP